MTALLNNGVQFPGGDIQYTAVQAGFIIAWYGAIGDIPPGWAVCDGTNGTPDLRNRFIVGAGSSYSVGTTGGAASVTINPLQMPPHSHGASDGWVSAAGAHSHSASVSTNPNHTHSFSPSSAMRYNPGKASQAGPSGAQASPISPVGNHSHSSPNLANSGDHTHSVSFTLGNVGGGAAHENRPPFYALLFLQKQ